MRYQVKELLFCGEAPQSNRHYLLLLRKGLDLAQLLHRSASSVATLGYFAGVQVRRKVSACSLRSIPVDSVRQKPKRV